MRRHWSKFERKSGLLESRRLDNLSSTVNELFQKAVQNEQILRRYQQFELQLLALHGLEELLDMLLVNALEYFQLDKVELWLYDPQGTLEELLGADYLCTQGLHLCADTAPFRRLYSKQPIVRLVSSTDGKKLPVFSGESMRSAALLPLIRHDVLVGSLHLGAMGHQRFTDDKATEFIAHLASIVSVCLENAVNQERLHRLSMYDMLTKVKNRRAFHQSLDKEVSRAARSTDALSLLFIDLDHFKQVNDNFGHPAGDKVLREVAQFISGMLRKTDHVCRYGGEEFALLLPNCGEQRAAEISERIREGVSRLRICSPDDGLKPGCLIHVTLSIGVCCWLPSGVISSDDEAGVATQLVAQADRGVYQSKAAGRDCVHYMAMD